MYCPLFYVDPVDQFNKYFKKEIKTKEQIFESIDWKFLTINQGFKIKPYVPKAFTNKNGKLVDNSGVTIATGVDLAYQSVKQLQQGGLNNSIIQKIKPFIDSNLKGELARKKLQQVGDINLSKQQVQKIDQCLRPKYFKMLVVQLENNKIDIRQIPICVVDVLYNRTYHSGGIKDPEIITMLKNKDYKSIPNQLRKMKDFESRMQREARHIEQGLGLK